MERTCDGMKCKGSTLAMTRLVFGMSLSTGLATKKSKRSTKNVVLPSSAGSRLLVSVGNSVLYLYDTLRPDIGPTAAFTGHATSSFFIKACFSPDGTHILSGSSDKNAYIWQVGPPSSCLAACFSVAPFCLLHMQPCPSPATVCPSCKDDMPFNTLFIQV